MYITNKGMYQEYSHDFYDQNNQWICINEHMAKSYAAVWILTLLLKFHILLNGCYIFVYIPTKVNSYLVHLPQDNIQYMHCGLNTVKLSTVKDSTAIYD